jgi:quercetin dioxygenase-like cupin family protein
MDNFYSQNELKKRELVPGVFIRTMWGEKIMMALIDIGPNAEVPLHTHPHEQCGRVLSGSFHLTIGGEMRLLREGDHYVIPGGVPHAARGTDHPSLALDIFAPPREEYKF